MKYLPLVWAGLWRKRVRTLLTALSVTAAFVLFGVLQGVTATIDDVIDQLSDNRLRTMSRAGVLEPLPLAHGRQIEGLDGVEGVGHATLFFGYYGERGDGVNAVATDFDQFFAIYPEVRLPEDQREAILSTRTGALVGRDLAQQRGWQVGDRVALGSRRWMRRDGTAEWIFDIVGIYTFADGALPSDELWIHYALLDETRTADNGTVNLYFAAIADAERAAAISESIDALFINSPNPTQTASEKEWVRAQVNQLGNIEFFIQAIIGAVLFTLLFLTGNTMMQSLRERIPELAVLKAYGYRDGAVVALVSAEALLLCTSAALAGLLLARAVFPNVFAMLGAPAWPMPWSVVGTGVAAAVVLALVSAAPPVWRIRRLSVVDALAGR